MLEGAALHPQVRWLFSATKLLVLPKSGYHGTRAGIRPIGVRAVPKMADFFALVQVGIALPGGCEIAVVPTRPHLDAGDQGLPS